MVTLLMIKKVIKNKLLLIKMIYREKINMEIKYKFKQMDQNQNTEYQSEQIKMRLTTLRIGVLFIKNKTKTMNKIKNKVAHAVHYIDKI